jgi:mercuric ion binding protein
MKKQLSFVIAVLTLAANTAWAAPRTVTLSVSRMTCAACPITVKKALGKVEGVSNVVVSLEKHQAVVTYDDGKTGVDRLLRATAAAGYPSTVAR